MPTSDNARRMLEKEDVINGDMGKVLAEFLIEHLPFEEDHLAMIDSVKAALQPGLVSDELRQSLWSKARTKGSYYVGFLQATPDDLPADEVAHAAYETLQSKLAAITAHNKAAQQFLRVMSAAGKNYLATIELALKRPGNQDVIVALFMAIENYFSAISFKFEHHRDIEKIISEAHEYCDKCQADDQAIGELISMVPEFEQHVKAMVVLSAYCEELAFPVFGQTDAVGSVMRKKIKHLTDPIKDQITVIRS